MAAAEAISCRRCGGAMERGFLLDHGHSRYYPSVWMAGPPEKSFWFGLKVSREMRAEARQVDAYRCSACGLVDLFARSAPAGRV